MERTPSKITFEREGEGGREGGRERERDKGGERAGGTHQVAGKVKTGTLRGAPP